VGVDRYHRAPGLVLSPAACSAVAFPDGSRDVDSPPVPSANPAADTDSLPDADTHPDPKPNGKAHTASDASTILLQGLQHREGVRRLVHLAKQVVQQGSGLRLQPVA